MQPEFIEEDFISGLETALKGTFHPPWPLEISRVSQDVEHFLGYDGVLTSLIPFYIQFKRSYFCIPAYRGQLAKNRDHLELPTRRGFFNFALHKDKASKKFLQHNVLFQLSQHATAAYVAPLFYKKQQLTAFKRLTLDLPWRYEDSLIYDPALDGPRRIRHTRSFSHCITVPPHREVTDTSASHHYTFMRDGRSLCFHSEPEIPKISGKTLDQFLESLANRTLERINENSIGWLLKVLPALYGTEWKNRTFRSMIKAYLLDLDLYPATQSPAVESWVFENLDGVDVLLLAKHMLMSDFNILQYVAKPW